MSTPMTNPDGVAYPPSVQRYADRLGEHDRIRLGHALEAAIAADREHRPPAAQLDQEDHDRLTNIYAAGMGAGAATALLQLQISEEQAQQTGLFIAGRMLEDPATRLQLEELTTRMWTQPDQPIGWQSFQAYPSPRSHRDD